MPRGHRGSDLTRTKLNNTYALAVALWYAAVLGHLEDKPDAVDRLASALIELATRQNYPYWLAVGNIFRGWARSACGDAIGISWIEDGIRDYRATGSMLAMPYYLALKSEALHIAHRTHEALETINDAQSVVARSEESAWCAELHRLRGVFLAAIGADDSHIEASFCEAIRTAKQQRSASLAARAEASYAEYRRYDQRHHSSLQH